MFIYGDSQTLRERILSLLGNLEVGDRALAVYQIHDDLVRLYGEILGGKPAIVKNLERLMKSGEVTSYVRPQGLRSPVFSLSQNQGFQFKVNWIVG